MRAVRFHGPGDIRVDEIDEPTCGKGQVKMRPAYTGICGTGIYPRIPNIYITILTDGSRCARVRRWPGVDP